MFATRIAQSGRARRGGDDAAALATLVAIILVAVGFRFRYDDWLAEWDILDFFLPNYGYVGDRIRSLEVPAWNPYFSSGTPMAGDAGGGWMYLPVMVAFSLFSAAVAIKVMVLLQSLIGATATYMLGRRLGLFPMSALFAAVAFAIGPALYAATGQSTVIAQISAFVPVGLLGAECALRASGLSSRLAWSGLAAVAIVQMLAAWPQGCMYGLLLIASWLAYRALVAPVLETGSRSVHFRRMLVTGSAMAVLTGAFGAAAILPRLDFSAQSTLPGGDYSTVVGGAYVADALPRLELLSLYLQDSAYWRIVEHNSAVLMLGLLALLLGRARYGIPFFAVASVVCIDLAATHSATRAVLGVLPLFERVHSHRPTASMYMVFLPLAMLSGAGVQMLLNKPTEQSAWLPRLLPLPVLALAILVVQRAGHTVGWPQISVAVVAGLLIVLPGSRLPAAWHRAVHLLPRIAVVGLFVAMLVYPNGLDVEHMIRLPEDLPGLSYALGDDQSVQKAIQTVLARHDPGTAAGLLQDMRASQPPFRYADYFGTGAPGSAYVPSTKLRLQPSMLAILAGARAARLGLEQISAYNPLHLKYYVEYIEAMNGARQDYHWLDVYAAAVSGSQLLDMLNVRFVLVPVALSSSSSLPIARYASEVYRDDQAVVYENASAFARAWLVHDVRSNNNGEGLALLADNSVDGRSVAYVDGPLPPTPAPGPLSEPTRMSGERVLVTSLLPETITIRSSSTADGLLVVSEPYADGWNAYVDGEQHDVLRTDHALQGVPLAAGDHTVVLKYEPRPLTVGVWMTGGAGLALTCLWVLSLAGSRRRAPPGSAG